METVNQNGITIVTGATAADSGLGSYHPGSKFFCANGLKVTISARTDGEGGFTASWNYNGTEYTENFSSDVTVIGGSWDGEVASTEIVMTGGTVRDIYGGGVTATATVTGNVNIEVYDGKITHLTGGGAAGKVGGNVSIVIGDDEKGPYIEPNIIGGGFVEGADVAGNVTLTINNGQVGPVPGPDGYPCQLIAGGGVFADVAGKVTVNVAGGEIYAIVAGGSMISGNVGSSVVNVTGGTVTQINGASVDYYNNGEIGSVGSVEINVTGGTILDAVVGGSVYRGEVSESVNINITGGVIGTLGGEEVIIAGSQLSDITGTTSVNIVTTGANAPQVNGAVIKADNFTMDGKDFSMANIYVGENISTDINKGIFAGVNAFADVSEAMNAVTENKTNIIISGTGYLTGKTGVFNGWGNDAGEVALYEIGNKTVTWIAAEDSATIDISARHVVLHGTGTLNIDKSITLDYRQASGAGLGESLFAVGSFWTGDDATEKPTVNLDGKIIVGDVALSSDNGSVKVRHGNLNVSSTGSIDADYSIRVRDGILNVTGAGKDAETAQLKSQRLELGGSADGDSKIIIKDSFVDITYGDGKIADRFDNNTDGVGFNKSFVFQNSKVVSDSLNLLDTVTTFDGTGSDFNFTNVKNAGTITLNDSTIAVGKVFENTGAVNFNNSTITAETFKQNSTSQAVFNNVVMDIKTVDTGANAWVVIGGASQVKINTVTGSNAIRLAANTTLLDGTNFATGLNIRSLGALTIGEKATDKIYVNAYDTTRAAVGTITVNGEWTIGNGSLGIATYKDGEPITLTGAGVINVNSHIYLEGYWPGNANWYTIPGDILIDKDLTINMASEANQNHLRFSGSKVTIKGVVNNLGSVQDYTALASANVTVTGSTAALNVNDSLFVGYYDLYNAFLTNHKEHHQENNKSTLDVKDGATVTTSHGLDNNALYINKNSIVSVDKSTFVVDGDVKNYGGIIKVSNSSFTVDGNMDCSATNYLSYGNGSSISISGNSTFTVSGIIEDIESIYIGGNANVMINATVSGKVYVANGTVLTGTLKTDNVVDVTGTVTLADNATISGYWGGGTIKANDTNDFDLLDGNSTIVLTAGDYTNDNFGSNLIKGASKNAEITVDAQKLDGTQFANAKVNFTNVEYGSAYDYLSAKIDFDNIKSINGFEVYKVGGSYFFTTDTGVIYNVKDNYGTIKFVETTELAGEYGNINLVGNLSGASVTMKSGNTTIKVANGEEASIGTINKSSNGGVNKVAVGNNSNLTVDNIERFGNITIGSKESEMTINEGITGTAVAETIKVGNTSTFNSKDINFASGKATITLGKDATANIDGDVIVVGANNTINVGAGATMNVDNVVNYCGNNIDENGNVQYASAVGTTIKLGKGAKFTTQSIIGLAGLSIANGSVDKQGNVIAADFTASKIYGTEKSNTISLGDYNNFESSDIDLFNGNDTFKTGKGAVAKINGNLTNAETITVDSMAKLSVANIDGVSKLTLDDGSFDKKTNKVTTTVLEAGNITATAKNDSIVVGDYADVNINGSIKLNEGNDKFIIGDFSDVEITGTVVFGNGKDTLEIGANTNVAITSTVSGAEEISIDACSDVKITGSVSGVSKLTVEDGTAADNTVFEAQYISGTGNNANFEFGDYTSVKIGCYESYGWKYYGFELSSGKDKLTVGDNSKLVADFRINFANGDDKFVIGKDSIVNVNGTIDFGQGKDILTLGKNSVAKFESISGVETIKATKSSKIIVTNGKDVDVNFEDIQGSWMDATIYDGQGTLESGMISGSVYANELDFYTFTGANSIILANGTDGSLAGVVVDLFENKDGNWVCLGELHKEELGNIGSFTNLNADTNYAIAIRVVDADFNKADDSNNKYNFKAVLA